MTWLLILALTVPVVYLFVIFVILVVFVVVIHAISQELSHFEFVVMGFSVTLKFFVS